MKGTTVALTPQEVREKTFTATRMKVGYNEDEVDAFLDSVEAELSRLIAENTELKAKLASGNAANAGSAAIQGEVIESVGPKSVNPFAIELRKSRKGDVAADTDTDAESATEAELRALHAEIAELKLRLERADATEDDAPGGVVAALSQPAPSTTEDMLSRALVLAQRTADEAVSQAREESARLVAEAMDRAVAMERAATVEQQAKVAEFQTTKSNLEAEIDRLRSFEREYRTRLRAYLEMQLRDLVGAGSSSPAPRAVGSVASTHVAFDDIEDAIEELDA